MSRSAQRIQDALDAYRANEHTPSAREFWFAFLRDVVEDVQRIERRESHDGRPAAITDNEPPSPDTADMPTGLPQERLLKNPDCSPQVQN